MWRSWVAAAAGPCVCGAFAEAAAAAQPTLGLAGVVSSPYASGFGQIRPSRINYAGDNTSFVNRIRWSSWGSAKAVGHGVANWVFPGWDNAAATPVKAELVAYGLGVCDGVRVYQHVEWFWPSRGDTFDPNLAGTNLCTDKYPPYHQPKVQHCAAVEIQSPAGLADKLTVFGPTPTCGQVRSFLRTSHLLRSFGKPVTFHEGPWWCGAQVATVPKQISCQRNTDSFFDFQATNA
jgi:hypothetical protein